MTADIISKPLTLPCGAVLSNRLGKAAMTEGLGDAHGRPTVAHERLYRVWAASGSGLLLTGNVIIDADHLERPGNVVIARKPDDETRARLVAWAKAGTSGGNHLWMQLSHAGRQTQVLTNPRPKAPSAVALALPGKQFGEPVALSEREIEDLIARFAMAAGVARETGFTGVQIHAAHGYLISQFLSPRSNRREDRWGGSLENRSRFLLETIAAVRGAVGKDFPVSVKLNSADFQKGGFAFEDSLVVARRLQDASVDLIEVSGGSYEQPAMMNVAGLEAPTPPDLPASTAAREAYFVDFAKAMRSALKIPVMVTGGLRSRAAVLQALESNAADVVGLGRPMCPEPNAPRQLLDGAASLTRWEDTLRLLPPPLAWLKRFPMVRALDGFAVLYWFYAQLYRLGRGEAVDLRLSVFKAFREVDATHRRLAREIKTARAPRP